MLSVGSLFSGIGGIDLGLEWAGMEIRWQAETDWYASQVLTKHWPNIPNLGDVKLINWKEVERVDLLAGGYPCTPFSVAGKRKGKEDRRHLWPYYLEAIRELRPKYALLENVPGHLSKGFGTVLGDLAETGYDVQWDRISAADVGAPHRRERVFAIAVDMADASGKRRQDECFASSIGETEPEFRDSGAHGDVPDSEGVALGAGLRPDETSGVGGRRLSNTDCSDTTRGPAPSRLGGDVDGLPARLDRTLDLWGPGWDDGVPRIGTGIRRRPDRLRGLGNAVVPQCAEIVGRYICSLEG